MDEIYPVTIIKTRYGGTYEGAEWVAVNMDEESSRFDDLRGGDSDCEAVFYDLDHGEVSSIDGRVFCGRGSTPDEAYEDLLRLIPKNKG